METGDPAECLKSADGVMAFTGQETLGPGELRCHWYLGRI